MPQFIERGEIVEVDAVKQTAYVQPVSRKPRPCPKCGEIRFAQDGWENGYCIQHGIYDTGRAELEDASNAASQQRHIRLGLVNPHESQRGSFAAGEVYAPDWR